MGEAGRAEPLRVRGARYGAVDMSSRFTKLL